MNEMIGHVVCVELMNEVVPNPVERFLDAEEDAERAMAKNLYDDNVCREVLEWSGWHGIGVID